MVMLKYSLALKALQRINKNVNKFSLFNDLFTAPFKNLFSASLAKKQPRQHDDIELNFNKKNYTVYRGNLKK